MEVSSSPHNNGIVEALSCFHSANQTGTTISHNDSMLSILTTPSSCENITPGSSSIDEQRLYVVRLEEVLLQHLEIGRNQWLSVQCPMMNRMWSIIEERQRYKDSIRVLQVDCADPDELARHSFTTASRVLQLMQSSDKGGNNRYQRCLTKLRRVSQGH